MLRVVADTVVGAGAEVVRPEGLAGLGIERRGVRGVIHGDAGTRHSVPVVRRRSSAADVSKVIHQDFSLADRAGAAADISHPEDKEREHNQLPRGMQDHVSHHRLRKNSLITGVRLPPQELVSRIFGGERQGSKGVHDQVDPEHLDSIQRALRQDGSANAGQRAGGDVDRQLELQELADVVVNAAAPLDGCDDGNKIVVHDDYVRSILSHVGPLNTHGKTNIGLLESGSVVGSVSSHGNGLFDPNSGSLDTRDQHVLVERRGASKHPQGRPDLIKL
mmetsp:Transcript_14331/g.48991  ORF Transcript_14331/g.48991 Transcript_14331/m.48991 type:complete len:276 (+) Transcript_14331:626-1453(+)